MRFVIEEGEVPVTVRPGISPRVEPEDEYVFWSEESKELAEESWDDARSRWPQW